MLRRTATAVCSLALILAVGWTSARASVLLPIGHADYYQGATKVGTYNLIYDPDAPNIVNGVAQGGAHGIVWLDYTRLDADNNPLYDTWQNQVAWATGLNGSGTITNYVLNTGYSMNWGGSSWRLPSTVDDDTSYGDNPPPSSSEMAHLYYTELGNIGYDNQGWGLSNTGDFQNILPDWYWSGTEYAGPSNAWYFGTADGIQEAFSKDYGGFSALAVRTGQLSTSAVPVPSTYLLLGIALGVVGYARRRMSAR